MNALELAEKLLQEKIVYADTAHDKGWNDAIDYIVAEYLSAQQSVQSDALEACAKCGRYHSEFTRC